MHFVRSARSLLLAFVTLAVPVVLVSPGTSFAQIGIGIGVSIRIAPPALPVYTQPVCPGDGYIWTPGYWAYGDVGYYWVPGTWVLAPTPGLLWTPGYWGWGDGLYAWHAGYWGPQVGFYGGVDYGFGYGGVGYEGGYWNHGVFNYNRSVNNINVADVHNVYNKTVVNNVTGNRVSYNGGAGGIAARPTSAEEAAARDRHVPATADQVSHERAAGANRAQLASVNHGRPAVAATAKPGDFSHAVPARAAGTPNHGVVNRGGGANAPVARTVSPGNGGRPANAGSNTGHAAHSSNPAPPAHRQSAPHAQSKPAARQGGESHGGGGEQEKK